MTSPRTSPSRLSAAFRLAEQLHAGQTRKGTDIPYIAHVLGVCSIAMDHGADEDEAVAALLHDVLEDAGPGYPGGADALRRHVETQFGSRVLGIVEACTDADSDPKPPWRLRKEAYLAHLTDAPCPVLLVSCADKLHNAQAILRDYRQIGEALWDRFRGGREGTLWYYRSLVEAFQENPATPPVLLSEFVRVVNELELLAASN